MLELVKNNEVPEKVFATALGPVVSIYKIKIKMIWSNCKYIATNTATFFLSSDSEHNSPQPHNFIVYKRR